MASDEVRPPPEGSYFITITLKPKLYKYSSTTQYELSYGTIQHILHTTVQDYEVVPEHTKDGNLHYHAWIYSSNPCAKILCLNRLKRDRSLGYIKLTPEIIIKEDQIIRVQEYLCKEFSYTVKILRSVPRRSLIINPENL